MSSCRKNGSGPCQVPPCPVGRQRHRTALAFFSTARRAPTRTGAAPFPGRSHTAMPTADIDLPAFSLIRVANIEPVLRELLDAHRAQLAALLARSDQSWDSL